MTARAKRNRESAFTLVEVLTCMVLLAIALAPVVQCLTRAQSTGTDAQRATEAVFLAERKIEDIRAVLRHSFGTDVSVLSETLAGEFLCTVTQSTESSLLKRVHVSVGYDEDDDGTLDNGEIVAELDTKIASRT